jgi:plastocyanin
VDWFVLRTLKAPPPFSLKRAKEAAVRHTSSAAEAALGRLQKPWLYAALLVSTLVLAAPAWTSTKADETVRITATGFEPATARIVRGDTVTWTNADTVDHRIVSTNPAFRSPVLGPGESFSFRYTRRGSFVYRDALKPGVRGMVNVSPTGPLVVTMQRGKRIVTFGGSTSVFGSISNGRSGETVTVVASAYRLGTTTHRVTTDEGAWELVVRPRIRTLYRATWRNRESQAEPAVFVRPRVSLAVRNRRIGRFTTKVAAAYSYAGKRVRLLRDVGAGTWKTVRFVRLGRGGTATFRARLPRVARVRVVVPASPGYLDGSSAAVTVRR